MISILQTTQHLIAHALPNIVDQMMKGPNKSTPD